MASKGVRQQWKDKLSGKSVGPATTSLGFGKASYKGTILGIDPSLRGTGLAVLEVKSASNALLLHSQTLRLKANVAMPQCLAEISLAITKVLDAHRIDTVALEQTIYVQNFQTAQILGAARGAAIAAVAVRGMPVFEYPPLRVKQAVVGMGRASKEQVAKTVKSLLGHGSVLEYDQADAAAVALTHAFTHIAEG